MRQRRQAGRQAARPNLTTVAAKTPVLRKRRCCGRQAARQAGSKAEFDDSCSETQVLRQAGKQAGMQAGRQQGII